jgi:hypothetical protein
MLRQPKSWCAAELILLAAAMSAVPASVTRAQEAGGVVRVDVSVVDAEGRPVAGLSPAQFSVSVDGVPRRVESALFVYRGPGAEAAARGAGRSAPGPALFEPARTILVVVDESSFPRGAEKPVVSVADRLLDRFGPADRVALVRVPAPAEATAVVFQADLASVRETLPRIRGRGEVVDLTARADVVVPAVPPAADTGASGTSVDAPPSGSNDVARQVDADPSAASRDHVEQPMLALARLISGLRTVPGPKTVVVLTAGLGEADAAMLARSRGLQQAVETEAIASRAVVYVLGLQAAGHLGSWAEFEGLSAASGGELIRVGRSADQALDRLGLAVSGFYHLEVEAPAGTASPARSIKVSVAGPRLTARTARRVAERSDPAFFAWTAPAAESGPAPGAAPPPAREADASARRPPKADGELDVVLARTREYLGGYFREFKNVVAEEDYTQTILNGRVAEARRTKADFLLVMDPDGRQLVPFRDVFEVDGRPVRDREDRLKKLFLDPAPPGADDGAARVQAERSRYNFATRNTVNVPTYPLTFLQDDVAGAFQFRRAREENVEGLRVVRVDFVEVRRPTVVRTPAGKDVVSTGSFWIEPLTGRVVKTFLSAARVPGTDDQATLRMEATVTYRRSDTLGLWVPGEMRETYRLKGQELEGRASYSNFRRFQVSTEQEIKIK